MYVNLVTNNWDRVTSFVFFQKWSSYGKNRVNSKFYMGYIGATQTNISMLNMANCSDLFGRFGH